MNHSVQILLQRSSIVDTCLIKDHTIDMYERMDAQFLALVNLNATRGKWSVSCLGHLTPGKEPQYTIEEEAGWTPEPLPGSKLQSVQPIASHYADSAILRPTETIAGYHLTVWV